MKNIVKKLAFLTAVLTAAWTAVSCAGGGNGDEMPSQPGQTVPSGEALSDNADGSASEDGDGSAAETEIPYPDEARDLGGTGRCDPEYRRVLGHDGGAESRRNHG